MKKTGISFGAALAIAMSYADYHSIVGAILDGIFGWLYVLYRLL